MAPLPSGPFRLCLMDPPWAFRTRDGADRVPTQAADPYATMSIASMAALPVGEIMEEDSLLAMWVVGSHLAQAIELAALWGFAYVTDLFCWAKQRLVQADQIDLFTGDIPPPPISMGYHTRKQVEPCLLFSRGRGLPVLDHGVPQMIVAPKGAHSRKPAEQYERLDRLYGPLAGSDGRPQRLEMFARNTRPGWESWGNEVGKFDAPAGAPVHPEGGSPRSWPDRPSLRAAGRPCGPVGTEIAGAPC